MPAKRLTQQLRILLFYRGGVQFDDHVLFGTVASAQDRRPCLGRNDNFHVSRREPQFIAAHPSLAFPSPVDDWCPSRLIAYVAPLQFFRQNVEFAAGRIDYRSTAAGIKLRLMKPQPELSVPREWKPPDRSTNECCNRRLRKTDTWIATANPCASCNQAAVANNRS